MPVRARHTVVMIACEIFMVVVQCGIKGSIVVILRQSFDGESLGEYGSLNREERGGKRRPLMHGQCVPTV
jgi:hypothetical protein